jgi:glycerol-3-phosphate dehydrogenase
MNQYSTEIAIIGGGICGLWLLNLLRAAGYEACLLEQGKLGQGQTLASQGMIHGGIKYALGGFTTPASETIASMPAKWRDCIAGNGPLDLTGLKVLSDDYFLFSDGALTAKVTAFFASKSLRGRISAINVKDYPVAFLSPGFKGSLYRLQDMVIDTSALLKMLQAKHSEHVYQAEVKVVSKGDKVSSLKLNDTDVLTANEYIFAAGEGNGQLLSDLNFVPTRMQLRPLKQVMVRGQLPSIFAHAVSLRDANKPRLTITSHLMPNGDQVWYLGGNLAELGAGMTDDALIEKAKQELRDLLPWVDQQNLSFRTLEINRAEPAQEDHNRPEFPFAHRFANATVCWPTKLTLTPLLGEEVKKLLPPPGEGDWHAPNLPLAAMSPTPWELAFG